MIDACNYIKLMTKSTETLIILDKKKLTMNSTKNNVLSALPSFPTTTKFNPKMIIFSMCAITVILNYNIEE